jgi:hypothetical protein
VAEQLRDVQLGDVAVELEVGADDQNQHHHQASGQRDRAAPKPRMAVGVAIRPLDVVTRRVSLDGV